MWSCSYERMCSLVTLLCYRMPRGGGQAAEPEGRPKPEGGGGGYNTVMSYYSVGYRNI